MKAKTIYSLISFQTLKEIFDLSKVELTSQEKSLYINCIYAHFKDKLISKENLDEFKINIKDVKNYSRWKLSFQILNDSGLIEISKDQILFYDKWNMFIDNKHIKIEEKINHTNIEQQLLNNKSMIEVVAMKNRISIDQINSLIKIFIKEQEATETKHKDIGDYSKHFIYWVKLNINLIEKEQNTSVKSKSKLLGL